MEVNYARKKVAIIGYGVEGRASYEYFKKHGATITICERDTAVDLPKEANIQRGEAYLDNLITFDLVVRSPGINPSQLAGAKKVTSVTKEFFEHSKGTIIGVTGTKGKGTTSTLIALLLKAAGHKVYLGGNIGSAALDFIDEVKNTDLVVLELSSYQLIDLTKSPHVAVGLMITSDHLQYHGNLKDYIAAKANIFKYQEADDRAVFYSDNKYTAEIAELSSGEQRPFFDLNWTHIKGQELWFKDESICKLSEIGLLGKHNLQNIAAAINATADYINDIAIIAKVLKSFTGLAHRLEFVREVDGVKYINDSYGSVPEATQAAIEAFSEPTLLIMGGYDKGQNFDALADYITSTKRLKQIVLIGQVAKKIAARLDKSGYKNYHFSTDIEKAVEFANSSADPGDVVLLAPGTSSFDMFNNFKERGEAFKRAVNGLDKP